VTPRTPVSANYVLRILPVALAAAMTVIGCASPRPINSTTPGGIDAAPVAKKQLTAAIQIDLPSMSSRLSSPLPGAGEMESFANGSLARPDINDVLRPQLAESIPTVENGLWKVLPDGQRR